MEQFRREFSANVSHEFKTPLTSISGFAELMKNGDMNKETMQEFAGDIYKESQHLISILEDVIKLSKLDEKTIVLDKKVINIFDIIKEVRDFYTHELNKKNITMELNGEPAYINAVPHLIQEIVFNLVDNAIKYNKENGSIIISVSKTSEKTTVKVPDIFATTQPVEGNLTQAKAQNDALAEDVAALAAEITRAKGAEEGLQNAINTINNTTIPATLQAAKDYADGLAGDYDAKGSAEAVYNAILSIEESSINGLFDQD